MVEKTWLIPAMAIGIPYKDFWNYTPHDVKLIIEGYKEQQKIRFDYDNLLAYLQGRYFVDALLCTVGNMFSKKGAKNLEYPKEPYSFEEEKELTQEEKDAQVKAIFANLERMKNNFERAKEGGNI